MKLNLSAFFLDFPCCSKLFALQLLAEDPALKRFKSHKKSVWRLKRVGDVLTIVVVAGMLVSLLQVEEIFHYYSPISGSLLPIMLCNL